MQVRLLGGKNLFPDMNDALEKEENLFDVLNREMQEWRKCENTFELKRYKKESEDRLVLCSDL